MNGLVIENKIDLALRMDQWATHLELSLQETGQAHLFDVSKIEQSTIAAASLDTDPHSKRIQEIRFHRMSRAVKKRKLPRQLYSYYADHFVESGGGNAEDIDKLSELLDLTNESDIYRNKKKKYN